MSGSTLPVFTYPENLPKWPKSVQDDQAAIEQARTELGPDADPKRILARAQEIKKEREPNSLVWRIAVSQ